MNTTAPTHRLTEKAAWFFGTVCWISFEAFVGWFLLVFCLAVLRGIFFGVPWIGLDQFQLVSCYSLFCCFRSPCMPETGTVLHCRGWEHESGATTREGLSPSIFPVLPRLRTRDWNISRACPTCVGSASPTPTSRPPD